MLPAYPRSVLLGYKPGVLRASQEVNTRASEGTFLWVGYFFNLSERCACCIYTVFSFLRLFWLIWHFNKTIKTEDIFHGMWSIECEAWVQLGRGPQASPLSPAMPCTHVWLYLSFRGWEWSLHTSIGAQEWSSYAIRPRPEPHPRT